MTGQINGLVQIALALVGLSLRVRRVTLRCPFYRGSHGRNGVASVDVLMKLWIDVMVKGIEHKINSLPTGQLCGWDEICIT